MRSGANADEDFTREAIRNRLGRKTAEHKRTGERIGSNAIGRFLTITFRLSLLSFGIALEQLHSAFLARLLQCLQNNKMRFDPFAASSLYCYYFFFPDFFSC